MSPALGDLLSALVKVIESRKGADPATSYSAKLLADPVLAAKKLGEEAVEVVIASLHDGEGQSLASESADLLYHWLVLLVARGISLDEVAACLAARQGISGLAEKAARPE